MSNFSDEIYYFKKFLAFPSIVHGVSSKTFGSIKKKMDWDGYQSSTVPFANAIGLDNVNIIFMQQEHGGNVAVVKDFSVSNVSHTDAMVTGTKLLPLAVLTADCLPILLYDPEYEVISAIHVGYKGLLNNIIENAVVCMQNNFGSKPENIIAGIGPGIERDCYEVGKDRIDLFQKTFPTFENIYTENDGKYYLDLRIIAQQCLDKVGILKKHRENMAICTKCDTRFYSYRGGDIKNRFVSIICLVKEKST